MAQITSKQLISPFLWFNTEAEDAAKFYCSIFPNSKITEVSRYTEVGPGPEGSVMVISFELDGQRFSAMNGGPGYPFTQAVSFVINCETQEEVDRYWEKLSSDGGKEIQCGWVTDKYGMPWQVVPTPVFRMLSTGTPEQVDRFMKAMFQMVKLDMPKLEAAFKGETVAETV